MDEPRLRNLLLRAADEGDEVVKACEDEFERLGQAGQGLTDDVLDTIVGLIEQGWVLLRC